MFDKELRTGAEQGAENNKRARVGEDLDTQAMMQETGAVGFAESDLKHGEAVEKFINQMCEETYCEFDEAISG